MGESIERFSRQRPDPDVLDGLLANARFVPGVFDDDRVYDDLERMLAECDEHAGQPLARVFYLATAPQFFPVIEVGPEHLGRLDTIVDPVLASELPTAIWWPYGQQRRPHRLLAKADVVLLDSDELNEPHAGLARAAGLVRSAYVVDLAWLRTTPWRERLATSFDPPGRLATLRDLNAVSIRHARGSAASGLLLAGWLASRLRWDPGAGIEIALEPFDQETPGLAGITVSGGDGFSLSLDRGPGGLCAHERAAAGRERAWQVLGASRGEAGILGDGVRQAQLRDPTYAPALALALELSQPRVAR